MDLFIAKATVRTTLYIALVEEHCRHGNSSFYWRYDGIDIKYHPDNCKILINAQIAI